MKSGTFQISLKKNPSLTHGACLRVKGDSAEVPPFSGKHTREKRMSGFAMFSYLDSTSQSYGKDWGHVYSLIFVCLISSVCSVSDTKLSLTGNDA